MLPKSFRKALCFAGVFTMVIGSLSGCGGKEEAAGGSTASIEEAAEAGKF